MDLLKNLFRRWRQRKVLTLAELTHQLHASVRTVRRRLKSWRSLASFNCNGRFYTLPDLPQFDEHGLWFHREIGFSRFGHLPQTLVALVQQAPAGLTATANDWILQRTPQPLQKKSPSGTSTDGVSSPSQ